MKQAIRYGTFETNSSSTHTLCICTEKEYEAWRRGETLFNRWCYEDNQFVPNTEEYRNDEDEQYMTYDRYWDDEYLEGYEEEYTSPSGDKIVVFGKYGYDG